MMKNLIKACLPILAMLPFYMLQAQISITQDDMAKVGDEVYTSTANAKIDVNQTGKNHVWDFSKLKPTSNDTVRFGKPSGLYALLFSGNIAQVTNVFGQKGSSFFKSTKSAWIHQGMGFKIPVLNVDAPLRYSNTETIYQFPVTDTSSFTDSFDMSMSMQGLTIIIRGRRTTVVDGYGKISTPFGTFDCLRLKSDIIEKDTFVQGIDNSRTEYTWLAKGQIIPIMQVVVSKASTVITYRDSARPMWNPNTVKVLFSVKDTIVRIGDSVNLMNESKVTGNNFYQWSIKPATYTFINGTTANSKNPQLTFSKKGQYSVSLSITGLSGMGSLAKKDYIMVTDVDAPNVDFTASRFWGYVNDSAVFTDLSNNTPTAWKWDIQPATYEFISATSAQTQNPVVRFTASGYYKVNLVAFNASGPGILSKPEYIYIAANTSISKAIDGLNITIYPNPAKQLCIIQTENMGACTFYLNDMQGRTIKAPFSRSSDGNTTLDVSQIANGLYLLSINTGNHHITKKIEIRH